MLTWRAPASDGGAPVTGYYVEQLSQFSSRWSKVNKKSISELTLTLTDLTMGEKYEVKVAAENEAGVGPFCDPISFIAKDPFGTMYFIDSINAVHDCDPIYECISSCPVSERAHRHHDASC